MIFATFICLLIVRSGPIQNLANHIDLPSSFSRRRRSRLVQVSCGSFGHSESGRRHLATFRNSQSRRRHLNFDQEKKRLRWRRQRSWQVGRRWRQKMWRWRLHWLLWRHCLGLRSCSDLNHDDSPQTKEVSR